MTEDARFEDGDERPLQLVALDEDDLKVVSALVQDAVFPITEMTWQPRKRRLGFLVNRVRREDQTHGRAPERVQALLVIDNVTAVASQGVDRADKEMILSILTVAFEPSDSGHDSVVVTLAGDGAIRARIDGLEVALKDVTRPYKAVSGKTPDHPE